MRPGSEITDVVICPFVQKDGTYRESPPVLGGRSVGLIKASSVVVEDALCVLVGIYIIVD